MAGGPAAPAASDAFAEDLVMGVPERLPVWIVAAIAGAAVIVCTLVVLLITR